MLALRARKPARASRFASRPAALGLRGRESMLALRARKLARASRFASRPAALGLRSRESDMIFSKRLLVYFDLVGGPIDLL